MASTAEVQRRAHERSRRKHAWAFRGPLADSYAAAATLVVAALVPYLALSAALFPLTKSIGKSLGLGHEALELTIGLSNAAYALGTVLAVQLAVHRRGRRMLLVYVSAFVIASLLAAAAPAGWVFVAALILMGLCTSLMLIAAVPPLVTGWPAQKMPTTGLIMNLCVFGAVALGPAIGEFQASAGGWRPLFWVIAGIGVVALAFAVLTFEDQPPQDPDAPRDVFAMAAAAGGCAAAFFGASRLEATGSLDAASLAPLVGGFALVVALVVHQYRSPEPLMPVKQLATSLPAAAMAVAVTASASAVGLTNITLTALKAKGPGHVALLFLPEFGGAAVTAVVFALLFRTRFTPVFVAAGMTCLVAAAAVLTGVTRGGDLTVATGAALLGLGVGASVSPALFIAGFSLRSAQIQRVFALIELLRGVSAFLVAPILAYAASLYAVRATGIETAIWICLGLAAAGGLLAAAVFATGPGRLQTPDLERWQEEGEPAWDSPPLFAALRNEPGA